MQNYFESKTRVLQGVCTSRDFESLRMRGGLPNVAWLVARSAVLPESRAARFLVATFAFFNFGRMAVFLVVPFFNFHGRSVFGRNVIVKFNNG